MLDWESLFKRYVWDSRTTPYFVPVVRLTRRQADNEIMACCLFAGILFAVLAVAALGDKLPGGRSPLVAAYCFSLLCAAVLLHFTKGVPFALYLGASPLAGLAFLALAGDGAGRERMDTVIVILILMAFAWYAWRLYRIARYYPDMPEGTGPSPRRRLFK